MAPAAAARQRAAAQAARLDGGVIDLALDLRIGRLVRVALVGQSLAQQQRGHRDWPHRLRAAAARPPQRAAAPQL